MSRIKQQLMAVITALSMVMPLFQLKISMASSNLLKPAMVYHCYSNIDAARLSSSVIGRC